MPSLSILAEPPVTIVDKVVDKGTRAVAQAYLEFLYTPEAQEIIAKNHYRPRDPKVAAKYVGTFANVKLFTIDEAFGGWQTAQKTHFADKAARSIRSTDRDGKPLVIGHWLLHWAWLLVIGHAVSSRSNHAIANAQCNRKCQ